MNSSDFNKRAPFLACLSFCLALIAHAALAAPRASDVAPVRISVSGISHGYTNADVRQLIVRGVTAAMEDDRARPSDWVFSIQNAPGNRSQTHIAATLQSGSEHAVSGYFISPTLGTAPNSQFVEEIREFAKRLLRRANT